jgi:hypothetical protein
VIRELVCVADASARPTAAPDEMAREEAGSL